MTDILTIVPVQTTGLRAVQWTGQEDALTAIQRLLWPDSPYRDRTQPHIGISVSGNSSPYLETSLQFAQEGDWIVREGKRVEIVKADLFAARYAIAGNVTTAINSASARGRT